MEGSHRQRELVGRQLDQSGARDRRSCHSCDQRDLTRSIQVEARGEVAELKDNINTMIYNLRPTTELYTEQDWLKTNLARFTGMLQGQRDLVTVGKMLLSELVPLVNAHQGLIYQM